MTQFADLAAVLELFCVAGQCLIVEIPLAVTISFLIELYEESNYWPRLTLIVFMVIWMLMMRKLLNAYSVLMAFLWTEPASSSGRSTSKASTRPERSTGRGRARCGRRRPREAS